MTTLTDAIDALTPSSGGWVAKVRRPGGGESVLRGRGTRAEAQAAADAYNEPYQSDDAYVEEWDSVKAAAWPSWTPERLAEIAAEVGLPSAR
jgi:hypothetical protein